MALKSNVCFAVFLMCLRKWEKDSCWGSYLSCSHQSLLGRAYSCGTSVGPPSVWSRESLGLLATIQWHLLGGSLWRTGASSLLWSNSGTDVCSSSASVRTHTNVLSVLWRRAFESAAVYVFECSLRSVWAYLWLHSSTLSSRAHRHCLQAVRGFRWSGCPLVALWSRLRLCEFDWTLLTCRNERLC